MLALQPVTGHGHGGVVLEDDQCLIRMGYLEAHFKIYLPQRRGHEQFCEDLPLSGEAVFVMEYLHDSLSVLPIEFRIIRNVTGLGRFARWKDVRAIADLDAVTVHYQPAAVVPDVFTALHTFEGRGEYVGVVRVAPGAGERELYAVFPFAVGFRGFGFWPWFALFVGFVLFNVYLVRRQLRDST
jgi:hypothetical protein